jgi:hypothetical protein
MMNFIRDCLFRLRWLVMSPRARYVYLWQRSSPPHQLYRRY